SARPGRAPGPGRAAPRRTRGRRRRGSWSVALVPGWLAPGSVVRPVTAAVKGPAVAAARRITRASGVAVRASQGGVTDVPSRRGRGPGRAAVRTRRARVVRPPGRHHGVLLSG